MENEDKFNEYFELYKLRKYINLENSKIISMWSNMLDRTCKCSLIILAGTIYCVPEAILYVIPAVVGTQITVLMTGLKEAKDYRSRQIDIFSKEHPDIDSNIEDKELTCMIEDKQKQKILYR